MRFGMGIVAHLFVPPEHTAGVVSRFRPTTLSSKELFSLSGIKQYTSARILLEEERDLFGIWSSKGPFYIMHGVEDKCWVRFVCWTQRETLDSRERRLRLGELDKWCREAVKTNVDIHPLLDSNSTMEWYSRL